ncbi:hypothetical protein KAR91_74115 [Candidatus Pacearchaeota archaeon]|nr:hypothetical protein [Candidatus Pacearchaeota archaeon]
MDFLTDINYLRVIEMIAAFCGCYGVLRISLIKRDGLYFVTAAQVGWMVIGESNDLSFLTAQGIILIIFNVIGIYTWRKKNIG